MILDGSCEIIFADDMQAAPVAALPLFTESMVAWTPSTLAAAHDVLVLHGSSQVKNLFGTRLRVIMIGVASGDLEFEGSPSDSSSEVMYIHSSLISGGRSAGVSLFAGSLGLSWIARGPEVVTIAVYYVFGIHR